MKRVRVVVGDVRGRVHANCQSGTLSPASLTEKEIEMLFRILTDDGKDQDVMGPLEEGNVYIQAYGTLVSGKPPRCLEVGESCIKRYSLSGQKPTTYKIVRVE